MERGRGGLIFAGAFALLAVSLLALSAPALAAGNGTTLDATITATSIWTATHQWQIAKTASPTSLQMFRGDSAPVTYTIGATDAGTLTQAFLRGTVTVANAGSDATQSLAIVVTAYTTGATATAVGTATVDVSTQPVIAPGQTATYSYTVPVASPVGGAQYKATADITITNHSGSLGVPKGPSPSADALMPSAFTVVNGSVNVDDTNGQSFAFTRTGSTSYSKVFACDADAGTHNNTATIRQTGASASAAVTVSCYDLSVTADSATQLTRTYTWSIAKAASAPSLTLDPDASFAPLGYSVTLTSTSADSAWQVAGSVTVKNPAPIAAPLIANAPVTAALSTGGSAAVSCPATSVAAGQALQCTYLATLPAPLAGTVSAVATLANAPSGTTPFGASTAFDLASPNTVVTVDPTVSLADTSSAGAVIGPPGSFTASGTGTASYSTSYTLSVGGYTRCGSYQFTNSASFTTSTTRTSGSASVATPVTVTCYQLGVTDGATTSLTRTYTWTIAKSATASGVTLDPGGATTTLAYNVKVGSTSADSAWTAAGTITVTNPAPVAASLSAVTAAIGPSTATVTCGASSIAAKSSIQCAWTAALPSAATTSATATAALADASAFTASSYAGSTSVDFSSATVTKVDPSVTVTDDQASPRTLGAVNAGDAGTFSYSVQIGPYATCGLKPFTNTAAFLGTSGATGSASVTTPITVTCYQLAVTDTSATRLVRTYTWSINKTAAAPSLTLDPGGATTTLAYNVKVGSTSADSAWAASGAITVTNPAPVTAPLTGITAVVGASTATVTCGGATSVAPKSVVQCAWTAALPSAATTSVTATAALADMSAFTTSSYAGSTPVDFSGATVTPVDPAVTVTDTQASPQTLGTVNAGDPGTFSYTLQIGPYATCGPKTFTNTASFTTSTTKTSGSASVPTPVSVTCYDLGLSDSAKTSLTRTYTWTIGKTAAAPSLTLDPGGATTTLGYNVKVGSTSADSAWAAGGSITISNPAPVAATLASVTATAGGTPATVTCSPLVIPAHGSTACSWSASLSGASPTTLSATATLADASAFASSSYQAGATPVDFSSATITLVDPSVTVTDTQASPQTLGAVNAGDPGTFSYTTTIGPYTACGLKPFTNTATFLAASGATGTASVTTPVAVTCYDLSVADTAKTSLTRTYAWTITKAAATASITLDPSATTTEGYTVNVASSPVDSAWAATGSITIANPAPVPAPVSGVTASVGPSTATVSCGAATSIAPKSSIECTWNASLPSAALTTVAATAALPGGGAFSSTSYSGSAPVDFSAASITSRDASVAVTDSSAGTLGTVTAGPTKTFTYSTAIGPYALCGQRSFVNTASFTTSDTRTSGSASVTTPVTVTCYSLSVGGTATTSAKRTWTWTITKSAATTALTLATGAKTTDSYTVGLGSTSQLGSWIASGAITVANTAPVAATLSSVTATSASGAATVTCPTLTIAAGSQVQCTWTQALASGASDTLKIAASLVDPGAFGSATYTGADPIDTSSPSLTDVDNSVAVTDVSPDGTRSLGTVIAGQPASPFTYSLQIGPYSKCGTRTFTNTASFTTNATSTTASSSATVTVNVPCASPTPTPTPTRTPSPTPTPTSTPGPTPTPTSTASPTPTPVAITNCTYTIGYWKNHPSAIPQYLPIWLGTPGGDSSIQVSTSNAAVSYLSMDTASNGIDKLYAQLLAAKVSIAHGADASAVSAVISSADTFLASHSDRSWSRLSAKSQSMVLGWATTLDQYNNGLIGPGHCPS